MLKMTKTINTDTLRENHNVFWISEKKYYVPKEEVCYEVDSPEKNKLYSYAYREIKRNVSKNTTIVYEIKGKKNLAHITRMAVEQCKLRLAYSEHR